MDVNSREGGGGLGSRGGKGGWFVSTCNSLPTSLTKLMQEYDNLVLLERLDFDKMVEVVLTELHNQNNVLPHLLRNTKNAQHFKKKVQQIPYPSGLHQGGKARGRGY